MTIGIAKVCTDAEITFIFRNIEGYTPSGLGARSFPVDRLAEENLLVFEIFKIC